VTELGVTRAYLPFALSSDASCALEIISGHLGGPRSHLGPYRKSRNHLGPSRSTSKSSRAISEHLEFSRVISESLVVISGHLGAPLEIISGHLGPTPSLIGSPSQHRGSGETRVTVSCEARPRLDSKFTVVELCASRLTVQVQFLPHKQTGIRRQGFRTEGYTFSYIFTFLDGLPGQDYMYPFSVIGIAPRYIPARAVS